MSGLQKFVLPVVLISLLAGGAVLSNAADTDKVMTKAEVEKIIHDYIMEHPDTILTAVDQYQQKSMKEKSEKGIQQNADSLFKDANTPEIGNPNGDVTVVEFFDYNCGYCKRIFPELIKLTEEDKNVRVVFKDLPVLGPTSETAAKWAIAAHKQGKYFEFHKTMMEGKGPINDERLEKVAKDIGLDVEKIKSDIQGTEILIALEKNRSLAGSLGIAGTPAFVIGDQLYPGAVPYDVLKGAVEDKRKENAKGG